MLAEGLTRAKAHGTELSRKLVSSIAALVDEFAATQQAGFEGLVTPFTTSNNIAIDSFESLDFEAKRSKADALAESSRMGMADAGQKAGEVSKLIEVSWQTRRDESKLTMLHRRPPRNPYRPLLRSSPTCAVPPRGRRAYQTRLARPKSSGKKCRKTVSGQRATKEPDR